jgi:3-dehydroquinate synthase
LEKYELPTYFKINNPEEFYEHFFLDKKTTDNKLKFIVPNHIGNFKILKDVDKKTLMNVLEKFTK